MSAPPKRTRARGPKVRTGCITCKIRHIKCDEGRPACQRCISTSRTCDGYVQPAKREVVLRPLVARAGPVSTPCTVVSQEARISLSREPCSANVEDRSSASSEEPCTALTLTKTPSIAISTDPIELRGFQFFRYRTGFELVRTLSSPDLSCDFMFQFSHNFEAVKQSAIALGLMGERLQISNVCTSKNPQANSSHLAAQIQYHKALKELRLLLQRDDDESLWAALTSCLMLLIYEFLQGNEAGVLTHLAMGYRVLDVWRMRSPPARENLDTAGGVTVLEGMTRIFGIFDVQASLWLKKNSYIHPESGPVWLHLWIKDKTLEKFPSLVEAEEDLEGIKLNLWFYHRARQAPQMNPQWAKILLEQQIRLSEDIHLWPHATAAYIKSRGSIVTLREINLSRTLLANHRMTAIQFGAIFIDNEEEYFSNLRDEFEELIGDVRSLIEPVNVLTEGEPLLLRGRFRPVDPMPTFSFCPGLIEPLYFVATRCRDLSLCREAIRILVANPWREGAWDSLALAKIALGKIKSGQRENSPSYSPLLDGALKEMTV